MGMFDNIKCDYPLPGYCPEVVLTHAKKGEFQTKDLDCVLDNYTITKNGELIHEERQYSNVPKKDRPYPNEEGVLGLMGSLKSKITGYKKINYTGEIKFYTYDDYTENFFEYKAIFIDGKLKKIEGGLHNE